MSDYAFNYSFNITGNASTAAQQITGDVTVLNNTVKQAIGIWDSFAGKVVAFNQLLQFVESYKLLLSQLSPELAKTPDALKAMGDNIAILSKTMGGDATAAAEVLITAMNQYGVSLANPMEASRKMAEMMNIMAAAGKEGSAELPTIKVALEQCGMATKSAGVSFAETNAAIQVLDKAGKKGGEGGVALRNVMAILSTGRFLPKDVQEELTAAGVNINDLTDKSKTLTERLSPLQYVLNDTALFTKLFGRENSNAAMALVQGISEVNRYTEAISGTNTAFDQAGIIMESYNEKKARVQARFDDFRISVFNATGDFDIWVETVAGSLVPLSQRMPLIMGVGKAMMLVKNINFSGVFSSLSHVVTTARYHLLFMNAELRTGQIASVGFLGNIVRVTAIVVRFATVGLLSGVKALGAWVLSHVTGGWENDAVQGLLKSPFSYAAGSLTAPIFGFGRKKAAYKAAIAAYEQSRLAYEQKVLDVFKEANDAIVTYRSVRGTARLKADLRNAAREYVHLANLQYRGGSINYIDVLDAQRRYFDAQVGLSNAIRDEYLALVALYKALGGGWQVE